MAASKIASLRMKITKVKALVKAVELAQRGRASEDSAEVEECVARQWFRFAIARFEQDMDGCSMESLLETFKATGQDLNALPRAVVETDAFLFRRPIDAHTKEMP